MLIIAIVLLGCRGNTDYAYTQDTDSQIICIDSMDTSCNYNSNTIFTPDTETIDTSSNNDFNTDSNGDSDYDSMLADTETEWIDTNVSDTEFDSETNSNDSTDTESETDTYTEDTTDTGEDTNTDTDTEIVDTDIIEYTCNLNTYYNEFCDSSDNCAIQGFPITSGICPNHFICCSTTDVKPLCSSISNYNCSSINECSSGQYTENKCEGTEVCCYIEPDTDTQLDTELDTDTGECVYEQDCPYDDLMPDWLDPNDVFNSPYTCIDNRCVLKELCPEEQGSVKCATHTTSPYNAKWNAVYRCPYIFEGCFFY
jgi:hypothetical protein